MHHISHQEGEALTALEVGDAVMHHNLPGVHDRVGVAGGGRRPPAQVDPTPAGCSFSRCLACLVTCTTLT